MLRVLLIDDDQSLSDLLAQYFPQYDIEYHYASNASEGIRLLQANDFDVLILDIILPDLDGFSVCKKIRDLSDIPIIMLTGKNELVDKVVGFELGADDYLTKPFEPRELVLRIKSLSRRKEGALTKESALIFEELEIYPNTLDAQKKGHSLELSSMECRTLVFLAKNLDRVVSKDEISVHIKGFKDSPYSRSIDVLVSRLRAKLQRQNMDANLIKTVKGIGYKFTGTPAS
ncbi:response regulator transcription factor [Pleionea sp. CnH1-48]|uniref:response regulator transcription factor n=1 Tax=Pleionea sp. CnH1-48 TaxID=2954494 RepID=UPI0020972D65|nr:response regulator transcription factor [Pleionea sp. CnH1-48]MCO7225975.1 response regulator transcription factor [Pleionea sp. CnH1-48]